MLTIPIPSFARRTRRARGFSLVELVVAMALGLIVSAAVEPRTVSLSGFLAGLGATWLVVWGRAIQVCAGPNTPTDGCVGPDLSGWSAVPIGILVIAGFLAIASLRRA